MGHKSHHHHSKEKERGHSKHKHHFSHSKRSSSQNSISSSSSSSTNSSSDSYSHHSHKKRKHHHKHHHKDKKNDKTVKSNSTETVKKENFLIGPSLPSSPGKLINVEKNLSDKNIQDINTTDNINKNFVGPMLPSFIQNDNENSNDESNNADKSSLIIGPSLPLSLNNNNSNDKQKINIIGPSLPSSFNDNTNEQNSRIIGPSLPSSLNNNNNNNNEQNLNIIGPSLPASVENKINKIIEKSEESDDDIIGPLPMAPGHELTEEEETQRIINEFEERADRMKRKLEGKDEPEKPKKLVRDEWMTTLPEDNILDRINILKPRQFRKNGTTKIDRSGWTDTPADKLRKQKEGVKEKEEKIEYIQINKNDINMQKMVDKYNKEYRSESLYDQHAKEYFKNKKYEENDISKLPFDRERDVLGVGSKGSIGKANQLKGVLGIESANRFTHSSSKRFL